MLSADTVLCVRTSCPNNAVVSRNAVAMLVILATITVAAAGRVAVARVTLIIFTLVIFYQL